MSNLEMFLSLSIVFLLLIICRKSSKITSLEAKYFMFERVHRDNVVDDGFDFLYMEAIYEAYRAIEMYPQPNYVVTKIAEEAGELVKEAIHCGEGRGDPGNLRTEMKQTIAMIYRLWIEGDQVHKVEPVFKTSKVENS